MLKVCVQTRRKAGVARGKPSGEMMARNPTDASGALCCRLVFMIRGERSTKHSQGEREMNTTTVTVDLAKDVSTPIRHQNRHQGFAAAGQASDWPAAVTSDWLLMPCQTTASMT